MEILVNQNKKINYVNRLNLYYRLNEVPNLLGISDKTARRLVKKVKDEDDRKGNNLIFKTNGTWNIHFSLLDCFLDKLKYKLSCKKQTILSTPWKSFLTVNINGTYSKEYYLELFKILKNQIDLKFGEKKYFPVIEKNTNNEYCHFHLLSTLSIEDLLDCTELVMNALLGNNYQTNIKYEYQCYCEKPVSQAKLVHYLYKGNLITDSDYLYSLDMVPPMKLKNGNN